jgi:hypothetical protein
METKHRAARIVDVECGRFDENPRCMMSYQSADSKRVDRRRRFSLTFSFFVDTFSRKL